MNWIQIKVTCTTDELHDVTAVMSMLDNRLMIEDYSDIETGLNTIYGDLIDESILNADKSHAKVSMYVDERNNFNDYLLFIKERFHALNLNCKIETIGVDDEDWENNWKKYYKPLKIGEHIKIVPMWEENYTPDDNEITVYMDPGLAFGSGTHETTRLCATLIEKYMEKGVRALDVGTGSGILAICEAMLGAKSVHAYDIDPIAVRVAKENAEKNRVEIECGVSDLLADVDMKDGPYDFVSANIVADIIIRMAPDLERVTKFGSLVCVSGVIDEYAHDVIECMENNGFGTSDILSDNGWKGILFKKIR